MALTQPALTALRLAAHDALAEQRAGYVAMLLEMAERETGCCAAVLRRAAERVRDGLADR